MMWRLVLALLLALSVVLSAGAQPVVPPLSAAWPCGIPQLLTTTPISQTASAQIIAGTSGRRTHLCGVFLMSDTAQFVSIVEGTGTTCATGVAAMIGATTAASGMSLGANGSFVLPFFTPMATAGDAICVLQSGAGRLSGAIVTVQF